MKKYLKTALALGTILLLSLAVVFSGCAAPAEKKVTAAEFYRGRNVQVIICGSPGGGYDSIARMLAPYLEKHTGATMVMVPKPGGEMLLSANYMWSTAPRDGSAIANNQAEYMLFPQLAKRSDVAFDMRELNWLCSAAEYPTMFFVGGHVPYRTLDDMRKAKKEIKFATIGMTGRAAVYAMAVLRDGLGIPLTVTGAFPGTPEQNLSVARGEYDATMVHARGGLPFYEKGQMIPIFAIGVKRDPLLPDVPLMDEILPADITPDGKLIHNVLSETTKTCRLFFAPPGVPQDRVDFLREAFRKALAEPELLAQGEKVSMYFYFVSGEEMQKKVKAWVDMDPKVVAILAKLTTAK